MKRYNVVIRICANVGVNASSPTAAKRRIDILLEDELIFILGTMEFVTEDGEVLGIFDKDWVETEIE